MKTLPPQHCHLQFLSHNTTWRGEARGTDWPGTVGRRKFPGVKVEHWRSEIRGMLLTPAHQWRKEMKMLYNRSFLGMEDTASWGLWVLNQLWGEKRRNIERIFSIKYQWFSIILWNIFIDIHEIFLLRNWGERGTHPSSTWGRPGRGATRRTKRSARRERRSRLVNTAVDSYVTLSPDSNTETCANVWRSDRPADHSKYWTCICSILLCWY